MNRICLLELGGMQTPHPAESSQSGKFTIFDPPGSTSTFPSAITANGTIIGIYSDARGMVHGFLRTPGGSYTTIDVPGSISTDPTDITPGGVITGSYCTVANCFPPSLDGNFLRALDGSITMFNPPGGFAEGPLYQVSGPPPAINPAGVIAGTYVDPSLTSSHGFERTPDGTFTTVDYPDSNTEILAINPAGTVVGDFCNINACFHGFMRTPDGTFTDINADAGIPTAINPAGMITGFTYNENPGGYVWSPDGSFAVFNPPGSAYTSPFGINEAGTVTGYYCAGGCRGFLRAPDGTITSFNPPGAETSAGFAINSSGVVTGVSIDANGVGHGFIYRP